MENNQNPHPDVSLRYFNLKEDYVYAQLHTQLTDARYTELSGQGQKANNPTGKVMFLALDESGSMSGMPFEALKKGSLIIGQQIYQNQSFEHFVNCFFQNHATCTEHKSYEDYQNFMSSKNAGGGTNFISVFTSISEFVAKNQTDDITVIFFTDGEDQNSKERLDQELERLQKDLKSKEVTSRFLTIGFTRNHNATLLNQIAQCGSELGNFFYIDTDLPEYEKQIEECLSTSLSMAFIESGLTLKISSKCMEFNDKLTLAKSYAEVEEDESKEGEEITCDVEINNPNQVLNFTNQLVIRQQVLGDIEGVLALKRNDVKIKLVLEEITDPAPELLARAQVQLINRLIFECIQEVQKQTNARTTQEVYEYVKTLDHELDAFHEGCYKIKDKETKKGIIQDILECKNKSRQIMEILRNSQSSISNLQIAQLNDLAYRAVRKQGLQKKLDERAIKNEAFYKKLDKQIKEEQKKQDFKALREQHKELVDLISSCPLSCNDLIESLEIGDCMCLCLDVGRSEACIADPTRLVIKHIIPTFMSSESFLDSATFALNSNPDAHGGFKISNKGKLAEGLGRENINAVLPLYLFKEHWEIARRKAPPIYGFICTLDIMGYASSQYFSIPFMVLLKAMENELTEEKQINTKIKGLIMDTCKVIMQSNQEFRNNVIKMVTDFHNSAEFRTVDIVSSIPIMIAQLYVLMQLENYEQYLKDFTLDKKKLQYIYRFLIEEQLRRNIKSDFEPLTKDQILRLLLPDYMQLVSEVMELREKEIIEEFNPSQNGSKDDKMAPFKAQAQIFKSLDNEGSSSQQEESKVTTEDKEETKEDKVEVSKVDIQAIIDKEVGKKPWCKQFEDDTSNVSQMITGALKSLNTKNHLLLDIANLLKVGDKDIQEYDSFPMIENDQEILLAMILQNSLHPKNSHRREAVTSKLYKEIITREDAVEYLSKALQANLKNEFAGKESVIRSRMQSLIASEQSAIFMDAPDKYYAAAVLVQLSFFMGRGDRNVIINMILANPSQCKAVKDKLILLKQGTYQNTNLFKDEFTKPTVFRFNFRNNIKCSIWRRLVIDHKQMTEEEFLEVFPERIKVVEFWKTYPQSLIVK